jgi:hypothetical protein
LTFGTTKHRQRPRSAQLPNTAKKPVLLLVDADSKKKQKKPTPKIPTFFFLRTHFSSLPPLSPQPKPHVQQGVKADMTSKGMDISGSATVNYAIDKNFNADLTVNEVGLYKSWRIQSVTRSA